MNYETPLALLCWFSLALGTAAVVGAALAVSVAAWDEWKTITEATTMNELDEARDLCRLLWRKLLRYTRGRYYLESTDERKALNELLALDVKHPWLKEKR